MNLECSSAAAELAELYRDMLELSPQMPWVSDPHGNLVSIGARWTEWTGLPAEQALGQGWQVGHHPEDLAAGMPLFEEALRTATPYEGRSRVRHRDGGYRWARIRAYPKLGKDGQVVRWYGLVEDIHEQVMAEERLRASEAHYRARVELSSQVPWTAGPDGTVTEVSARYAALTGITLGADWRMTLHPDDRGPTLEAWQRSVRTGEPYDIRHRLARGDGTHLWCRSRAWPLKEDGRIVRWYGAVEDIHEQVEAEQRLRESEARLRLAQDAAGLGNWDVDLVTGRATLSPRSLEMLGVPGVPADAAGTYPKAAWAELIHPDDRAEARAATQRSVETGEPFDHTYRVQLPDGGTRWIQGLGRTERDDGGRPVRMIGVNIDVTARVEAERAVRQAEERFRLAARATRNLIYDWNAATDCVQWSEAISSHFGYALESVCPAIAWWKDKVHPDDREQAAARLQAAIDSDAETRAAEYRFRRADGTYADIYERGSFVRDAQGKAVRMVGAMLDRTEWKQAENRLRESEARFRQMADTAPVMIWMTDARGAPEYFSRRWHEFTGLSEGELKGRLEFIHPDDRSRAYGIFLAANEQREGFRCEYRLQRTDGEFRWVLDIGSPRVSADGAFHGFVGSALDITDRKEAEAELEQAHFELLRLSRLSAMGAMASTLAHELNQPLAAATNYASAIGLLLSRGDAAPAQVREAADRLTDEVLRAGDIIRRVRSFTMEGRVNQKTEDLARIADRAIATTRSRPDARGVTITGDFAADAKLVEVDATQIEQVLINLMRNAVEAMADSPVRHITLTARRREDKVDLFVADTGPGLSPEMHENLFRPFASSKGEGMGLGLALGRTIVEAHGGRMWAEAPDGGGAVIAVALPAAGNDDGAAHRRRNE